MESQKAVEEKPLSLKDTAEEVVDALAMVSFLKAAITGMAWAGSQAAEKKEPSPEGYVPIVIFDHSEACGLANILSVVESRLTAACDSLLVD